ncbi:unnamed protein product, partial [Bubo scandiacus]
ALVGISRRSCSIRAALPLALRCSDCSLRQERDASRDCDPAETSQWESSVCKAPQVCKNW